MIDMAIIVNTQFLSSISRGSIWHSVVWIHIYNGCGIVIICAWYASVYVVLKNSFDTDVNAFLALIFGVLLYCPSLCHVSRCNRIVEGFWG